MFFETPSVRHQGKCRVLYRDHWYTKLSIVIWEVSLLSVWSGCSGYGELGGCIFGSIVDEVSVSNGLYIYSTFFSSSSLSSRGVKGFKFIVSDKSSEVNGTFFGVHSSVWCPPTPIYPGQKGEENTFAKESRRLTEGNRTSNIYYLTLTRNPVPYVPV